MDIAACRNIENQNLKYFLSRWQVIEDRESMQNLIDNRHLTVIAILVKAVTIVLEMTSPGDASSKISEPTVN